MRRRELIRLFACAAVMWSRAARALQPAVPVIGYLSLLSPDDSIPDIAAAFAKGLAEMGYVVGNNVTVERRWARGKYDRLPELAQELVRLNPQPGFDRGGGQCGCARRKARNFNHSHRVQYRVRPGEARTGKKLRSSRRQRHRHICYDSDAYRQAS